MYLKIINKIKNLEEEVGIDNIKAYCLDFIIFVIVRRDYLNINFKKQERFIKLLLNFLFLFFPLILFAQAKLLYPQEVIFYPEGGFFSKKIRVELSHNESNIDVYYTTDGSVPTKNSERYTQPITLKKTTVIRAVAFNSGKEKYSRIESSTYFVDEPETDWLVVSLAVNPEMLFDTITGLFEKGVENDLDGIASYGANFWDRKEHFINAEIFESDSSTVYRSPCGFRLFGGMSRTFPQKSMLLISRKRYGNKRFKHRFFDQIKLNKFKYLILRNAGSDWGRAHARDPIINGMVDHWDIDKQAYRPCHVYLNGEYFGVYYLREKINAYFIGSHHKEVDPDTLDLIEHRLALRKGSKIGYEKMIKFLEEADLSKKKYYDFLQTLMNVEKYADYKLLQIFIDNSDAGGNIKFWRSDHYDKGRWQWILYDTDWGFGLMNSKGYLNNSLAFHTRADGPPWPNPPWSTLILRKLLENKEFEHLFINRFCDQLNTTFLTDTMLTQINEHQEMLRPEIPRQFKRWNQSERVWRIHFNRIRKFAKERPNIMWSHLQERFETGQKVDVEVTATGRGRIWINENLKATYKKPYRGSYFANIPITLHAQPRLGFKFSHWEGTDETKPFISLDLSNKSEHQFKAVFTPLTTVLQDSITFNEISCYNNKSGDWVEIHNLTQSKVNVSHWIIKNKKNEYKLPEYWLGPNAYLVVAKDTASFKQSFPQYGNKVLGDFDFGLDKREDKLELYTKKGAMVDTFSYSIQTPGTAFTIDLKSPGIDNGNRDNWEVKYGIGSPASHNPSYLAQLAYQAQVHWMWIGIIIGVILIFLLSFFAAKNS